MGSAISVHEGLLKLLQHERYAKPRDGSPAAINASSVWDHARVGCCTDLRQIESASIGLELLSLKPLVEALLHLLLAINAQAKVPEVQRGCCVFRISVL